MIQSDKFIPNPVAVIDDFLQESVAGEQVATLGAELDIATTTSVILANVDSDIISAHAIFKIEDELLIGQISGTTLTFVKNSRPAFGKSAVTHAITTPVLLATFSDVIGSNVFHMAAADFSNSVPGVIYSLVPENFDEDTGVQRARITMKVYGGQDLLEKHKRFDSQLVNGLWVERARAAVQKRYTSGMVGTVFLESWGQQLLDNSSGIPAQPFVLSFALFEIL